MAKRSNNGKRKKGNNKSQRNEILGIILFSVSLLLMLGILSGEKFLGDGGALVGYLFASLTFGYPMVVLPALLAVFAVILLFHRPFKGLLIFSVYCVIGMVLVSIGSGLLNFLLEDMEGFSELMSGQTGRFVAEQFHSFLGTVGSSIVWITLTILFITRVCHINLHALGEWIRRLAAFSGKQALKVLHVFERGWAWLWLVIKKVCYVLVLAMRYKPHKEEEPSIKKEKKSEPAKKKKERVSASRREAWEELVSSGIKTVPDEPENEESTPSISEPVQKESDDQPVSEEQVNEEEAEPSEISVPYELPGLDLLDKRLSSAPAVSEKECRVNAELIETTLADFGVEAKVVQVDPGPVITLYEVTPAPGVKISRIAGLADDLALVMKAKGIRIIAPIPGKSVVGIEIPNADPSIVYIREVISSQVFHDNQSKLTIALGKTISGKPYCTDLARMPHLLIAGSTGAGKSVGINTIITSMLYKAHPTEVQFVMIDPKKLELSLYGALKKHHLLSVEGIDENVITKPQNATIALRSAEKEMERRYELLAGAGVRNIDDYNRKVSEQPLDSDEKKVRTLPYIVIIIDELADLMMTGAREVEEPIARLAQMSRAVGIHLVIATQRPSVDVLTGIIKANFSARIAYQVATKIDSRTILDMNGAEQLLGSGDMLFLPTGEPKPIRLQSAFISTEEVERIVEHISHQPFFVKEDLKLRTDQTVSTSNGMGIDGTDELLPEARKLIIRHQQGSISLLQRRLKVGYSRAARLIDLLEDEGVVGPFDGSKARQVLVDEDYLENF